MRARETAENTHILQIIRSYFGIQMENHITFLENRLLILLVETKSSSQRHVFGFVFAPFHFHGGAEDECHQRTEGANVGHHCGRMCRQLVCIAYGCSDKVSLIYLM